MRKQVQMSTNSEPGLVKLGQLLGSLTMEGRPDAAAQGKTGQCLHIVDFIPSAMLAEEEVTLGSGVVLKINARPKLEKVSPGMWIAANAKILQKLMDNNKNFDVPAYGSPR